MGARPSPDHCPSRQRESPPESRRLPREHRTGAHPGCPKGSAFTSQGGRGVSLAGSAQTHLCHLSQGAGPAHPHSSLPTPPIPCLPRRAAGAARGARRRRSCEAGTHQSRTQSRRQEPSARGRRGGSLIVSPVWLARPGRGGASSSGQGSGGGAGTRGGRR